MQLRHSIERFQYQLRFLILFQPAEGQAFEIVESIHLSLVVLEERLRGGDRRFEKVRSKNLYCMSHIIPFCTLLLYSSDHNTIFLVVAKQHICCPGH